MPKVPKGEMGLLDLRRLVKQYNLEMSVKVKGLSRDELISKIQSLGYKIDHENKKLVGTRGVKDKARRPAQVKMPPAKPKATAEEKAQKKRVTAEKKAQQRIEVLKTAKKQEEALSKLKKFKKPVPKKPAPKKEDEVRAGDKSARPRVDPKKLVVIKKPEAPAPKKPEAPAKDGLFPVNIEPFVNQFQNLAEVEEAEAEMTKEIERLIEQRKKSVSAMKQGRGTIMDDRPAHREFMKRQNQTIKEDRANREILRSFIKKAKRVKKPKAPKKEVVKKAPQDNKFETFEPLWVLPKDGLFPAKFTEPGYGRETKKPPPQTFQNMEEVKKGVKQRTAKIDKLQETLMKILDNHDYKEATTRRVKLLNEEIPYNKGIRQQLQDFIRKKGV